MKILSTKVHEKMNSIVLITLLGTAVLLPLLILPLSDNFLLNSKFFIVFVAAFVVFLLWSLYTAAKKTVQLTLSPFVAPMFVLAVLSFVSVVLNNTYIVSSLVNYGGLFIALAILFITGSSLLTQKESKVFVHALILPGLLLSVFSFAELLGWGPSRIFNGLLSTQFPNSPLFSISGSPLIAAEFLFVILAGVIALAITQGKKKLVPFYFLSGLIFAVALIVNIYTVYQAQLTSPLFLPYGASWSIMIDGLKSVKSSLIGFGPDNYGVVFLHLKPVWLNTTPVWAIQFIQANNFFLNLITTLGLVGLGSWIALAIQAIRRLKGQTEATLPAAAIFFAALLIEFFLPPNPVLLGTQILALIFWVASEKHLFKDIQLHSFTVRMVKADDRTQRVPEHSNGMVYGITIMNAGVLIAMFYFLGRAIAGDAFMFLSEIAGIKNRGIDVYNYQQQAITLNPYMESYRRKFSATNMTIALALSNAKANNPDKDKVPTLVQQGIQEARVATVLNPPDSTNWVNLARVYSTLIGSVDQAPQFAVDAYSQAIANAPTDPILRLEVGGIFYRTKIYDQAALTFEQLVTLKSNWPNAYYNLAITYRQRQEYDKAMAAYQETLSLTDSTSPDYIRVKSELEDLQRQISTKNAQQQKQKVVPVQQSDVNTQPVPNTLVSPTASTGSAILPPRRAQDAFNKTIQSSPTP